MEKEKSRLIELIEKYEELREKKEKLANETKANNEAFKQIQEDIVEQMVEDDIPSQGLGDYTYKIGRASCRERVWR